MQIIGCLKNLFYTNQFNSTEMKNFILIGLFALILGMSANAQRQNKLFLNDTVSADTTTYTSNLKVDKYAGVVVNFTFTKIDVTDSLAVAKLQGSNDNSAWIDLADATANLTNTSTDGTTNLYIVTPIYLYYRGFLACASGDAVAITNARVIIKED